MLRRLACVYISLATCAWSGLGLAGPPEDQRPPNIIFILADDLGFGDIGCFGQTKIRTPNIDRLAAEGMRFTRHYSGSPVCAPSRCTLLTGLHSGHAFIRDNREAPGEGQFPIPAETVTLTRLLKQSGYATGGFGKWGLGPPGSSGDPIRQGFDRFYGYNCQRVAHNFYPTHLWDNDRQVALDNPPFASQQKLPADADPNDPKSYARYSGKQFAPDLIAEQALAFIREQRDRPLFIYFPTTIPHLALQVPDDSLAEYVGKFDDEPYVGGRGYLPHRTPRAAYAAMVARLDRYVGQMLDLVAELGLDERTIFVFTSDNGPAYDRLGGTDSDFFNSASGLRGRKGSVYEGGIRVPLVVRWKGRIAPGTKSDRMSGFEDWLPTLLELVGRRDAIPKNLDGVSLAATLVGERQSAREYLYREFPNYGGQQALWMGDWKAVRQNLKGQADRTNDGAIELYKLQDDERETKDVSAEQPEVVAKMRQLMQREHRPSKEFPFPALDRDSP